MKLKLNWEKGGGGAECLCRGLNEERLSENDSIKNTPAYSHLQESRITAVLVDPLRNNNRFLAIHLGGERN